MHITRHARTRSQQRCVTPEAIGFALDIGKINRSRDRASVYSLTDRVLEQHGLPRNHRLRGVTVVEVDGFVVTVWKNAPPHHRGEGRRRRDDLRQKESAQAIRDWNSTPYASPWAA